MADRLHSLAIHLLRLLRREDQYAGLSAPTMSRLVRALEAARLIAREPDPADARDVLFRASPKGARLLAAGRARWALRLAV